MGEIVTVQQLVHGGQGMAILPDGKNVFMWNTLPLEEVAIEIIKSKKSYAEATVTRIIKASPERAAPKDEAYLSTSPWQILTYEAENKYKQEILLETFERAGVDCKSKPTMYADPLQWNYRNKMEYSFWADEAGLHLALFNRGTHSKMIVEGSSIARPEIDATAQKILSVLNKNNIRGSQLKTVVVRCDQQGNTVAALFVKDENFPKLDFKHTANGVAVYFSNPKSPASVLTKQLYREGDISLTDNIMGHSLTYDVNSFFQVHIPVFIEATKRIKHLTGGLSPVVDMYAGVGTLGILANATKLIELDEHNIAMAKRNVGQKNIEVIHASAEAALEHIPSEGGLIVDPPRAGLHRKVVDQILEAKPQIITYLSCNPSTQARDLVLLQDTYNILGIEGYNFFPRTPHIESLVTLERKP